YVRQCRRSCGNRFPYGGTANRPPVFAGQYETREVALPGNFASVGDGRMGLVSPESPARRSLLALVAAVVMDHQSPDRRIQRSDDHLSAGDCSANAWLSCQSVLFRMGEPRPLRQWEQLLWN